MKSDSPIDALILKIKGKRKPADEGDSYDAGSEAKEIQGKKLLKAIEAKDPAGVAGAVCALIDLHEPKPVEPSEDDDAE